MTAYTYALIVAAIFRLIEGAALGTISLLRQHRMLPGVEHS